MSSLGTINIISNNNSVYSGSLVITDYGSRRLLEKITKGSSFTTINLKRIVVGDRPIKDYTPSISAMRSEVLSFDIERDNIFVEDNKLEIKTDLEVPGEVAFQEIGLFEYINNEYKLFAYASGFNVYKPTEISYSLTIKLSLKVVFENEHYSNYTVQLENPDYAKAADMSKLFRVLTDIEVDLEKCISMNAKELGYNKAQLFYEEQKEMSNCLQNTLLFGRYIKLLPKISSLNMSDCFIYPTTSTGALYKVRNLKDNDSVIEVSNQLQLANYDHIDLSKPNSIVIAGSLGKLQKEGLILGKINPNNDESYFDIRVEKFKTTVANQEVIKSRLVFSIYSYAKELEYEVSKGRVDEFKMVGWYRLKYEPDENEMTTLLDGSKTLTFIYNGDINNPNIDLYIDTVKATNVVVDNFNYFGPCEYFRDRCTLRNYTQTSEVLDYETPYLYIIEDIEITEIMVFQEEIDPSVITYLSLVNQG